MKMTVSSRWGLPCILLVIFLAVVLWRPANATHLNSAWDHVNYDPYFSTPEKGVQFDCAVIEPPPPDLVSTPENEYWVPSVFSLGCDPGNTPNQAYIQNNRLFVQFTNVHNDWTLYGNAVAESGTFPYDVAGGTITDPSKCQERTLYCQAERVWTDFPVVLSTDVTLISAQKKNDANFLHVYFGLFWYFETPVGPNNLHWIEMMLIPSSLHFDQQGAIYYDPAGTEEYYVLPSPGDPNGTWYGYLYVIDTLPPAGSKEYDLDLRFYIDRMKTVWGIPDNTIGYLRGFQAGLEGYGVSASADFRSFDVTSSLPLGAAEDANGDRIVDNNDKVLVQNALGSSARSSTYDWRADIDNDGNVDSSDLDLVVSSLGTIVSVGGTPPFAQFSYSPAGIRVGQLVAFNASASFDRDGTITFYRWNFGDASPLLETGLPVVNHSFQSPGLFTVELTVADNRGMSSTRSETIQVKPQEDQAPAGPPVYVWLATGAIVGLTGTVLAKRYLRRPRSMKKRG